MLHVSFPWEKYKMMADISDLEIFARVVSAGSLSAAGRELDLSPAVVSKRLRRLEDHLGTRLLQRTTRQIALTEAGQGYFERIVPILAGLDEAEAFVTRRSTIARGTLKITAPTSFGRLHIAPYLRNFMIENPDLNVNLMLTDTIVDIVGEGIDLAIRIGELADSSLVAKRLAPVSRILVAAPQYFTGRTPPKTLNDLGIHICIAPHNGEPWRLEGPEGSIVYRPIGPLLTNSSEVVREAVIGGVGIALRSTWDVGPELASGALVRVLPEYEGNRSVAVHALYPSKQFLPAKVRLFIDYLVSLYAPTPPWDHRVGQTTDSIVAMPKRRAMVSDPVIRTSPANVFPPAGRN
jgi:DNA-binding transcriptional LysR family regulator